MKHPLACLLALMLLMVFVPQPAQADNPTEDEMAFCTIDDLVAKYGTRRLAQATGNAQGDKVDEDTVQKEIDDYGEYMEVFVRMQHPDQPFNETHKLLNGFNVEGAWIGIKKGSPSGIDQMLADAEKRLDRLLRDIGSGAIRLMDAEDVADPSGAVLTPSSMIQAKENLFGGHRQNATIT